MLIFTCIYYNKIFRVFKWKTNWKNASLVLSELQRPIKPMKLDSCLKFVKSSTRNLWSSRINSLSIFFTTSWSPFRNNPEKVSLTSSTYPWWSLNLLSSTSTQGTIKMLPIPFTTPLQCFQHPSSAWVQASIRWFRWNWKWRKSKIMSWFSYRSSFQTKKYWKDWKIY